jgi:hypothetical protein
MAHPVGVALEVAQGGVQVAGWLPARGMARAVSQSADVAVVPLGEPVHPPQFRQLV